MHSVNMLRPRKNVHRFADDFFEFVFLRENCFIWIQFFSGIWIKNKLA